MRDNSPASLERLLTQSRLARLAGPTALERGRRYFEEGRVESLRYERYAVRATVVGTKRYQVALREEQGGLEYSCSCPIGLESSFCKHCVAAALAWLERGKGPVRAGGTASSDAIRDYLSGLPAQKLVEMVLAQTSQDERLFRKLSLDASKAGGKPDLAMWRREIDAAMGGLETVGYEGAGSYADRLHDALDALDALVGEGHAASVLELVDYLLDGLEELLEELDDSEGEVQAVLERVEALHLAACEKSRPDPEALAEWLFEREMGAEQSIFFQAIGSYAELLGAQGLAAYRRLAEAEWQKLPVLVPGESDPDDSVDRFRITSIMQALAELSGDLEAWVAVRSRDLSHAHAFFAIAEAYRKAAQPALALDWAERGWLAFRKTGRASELRELLADLLQEAGRDGEAIELAWQAFAERPGLESFQLLKRRAKLGENWPVRRRKALDFIRALIWENEKPRSARREDAWRFRGPWDDHSVLVEILLWEDEIDAAWEEAQESGCNDRLWLKLAERRESRHPLDAIAVYRDRIPVILAGPDGNAYERASELLARVKKLLLACGKKEELAAYIAEIRSTHRRKRNFMKMLDLRGL
jgi:uncharacterized Zn finger protein